MITHLIGELREWLPAQRWYGDKGREIESLAVEVAGSLPGDDPAVYLAVVAVNFTEGTPARYQVPVAVRSELPHHLEHAVIGTFSTADGQQQTAYDALHDTDATARLFESLAGGNEAGRVRFSGDVPAHSVLNGRLIGAEQSNSSVVYGDEFILKVFRRLSPGANPDLEVGRALAAAGCEVIAKPIAWFELDEADEATTLGMLQPYFRGGTDGWALAITSVRDLLADPSTAADEAGGDFAPESERLGEMTAVLHRDLRTALGSAAAPAAEQRRTAAGMHARLDEALAIAPSLREHETRVRGLYEKFAKAKATAPLQRVHGDYHLGQVLRTDSGWIALDFEGARAKSLDERRMTTSPLRDVAGMLRSFDYAARYHLVEHLNPTAEVVDRAAEWSARNRSAFCDGYARAEGLDPRDAGPLLAAYELDQAVYEVVYETRNRPTWVEIPLGSIARLVEGE